MEFFEPWIDPDKALVDVGAGVGHLAAPLAERLRWVTPVEPSAGMWRHIPGRPNLFVVASTWEEAEAGTADLVICLHVLYSVRDPVRFIEKLEAAANERVSTRFRSRCRGARFRGSAR
jgi:2-polyprenyl-3-methyl-5-hydroxy-6-metoxy-1,4-benzoquinol methylase